MNRRSLDGGLVAMAAMACVLAAPGLAAAVTGPHHRTPSVVHPGLSPHRTVGLRAAPPVRRSLSGHVSPYARSRAGQVDPGDVDSIRSYYQRDTIRPAPEDGRPAVPPPGAGL